MKQQTLLAIHEYELPITVSQEKDGSFLAVCSLWQDCYAQGDTIEEAINEISYVASSLIELYKEEDLKIPLKPKKTTQSKGKTFTVSVPLIVSAN